MTLTGELLIGGRSVRGDAGFFRALNPATGERLAPDFSTASQQALEQACALAAAAFDPYRSAPLATRARLLESIAEHILATGDELLERAVAETGLPRARLEGERSRTVGQLRLFAEVVREGNFLEPRLESALAERKPPRPDLRLQYLGVGPVAVFGASNFPLAFSVAGGDTASALAAGCPVIVKAHNAHPGVSELVGRAVQAAVAECGLPEGTFSLLFALGTQIGAALVADARIKSVGFTGSRAGGLALMRIAAQRPEPIPVHAEMSSINPVFLLPHALEQRAAAIARGFVGSVGLGAGQFCTNPGLVPALEGRGLEQFVAAAVQEMSSAAASTMLTPDIHRAYERGVTRLGATAGVDVLARGAGGSGCQGQPALFGTSAATFLAQKQLQEEVFGASSVVIRCGSSDELIQIAEQLEGQLTVTLHLVEADVALARRLLPILERKAGRILVNGFPTGVEVSRAMVHGGPYPATSDARFTSVGTLAIRRFLRPVCYQDFPAALLPEALLDANPLGLRRLRDGEFGRQ
jgi:NADP-dependent aldehyde dehydrogenase